MITAKQKKTLKKFLAQAAEPDDAFTYDELIGYLFGIAMTPDVILPSEWLPIIFNGDIGEYPSPEATGETVECLMEVYNSFVTDFNAGLLHFPYDLNRVKKKDFDSMYLWASGFDEALALRPEIWEPEEMPFLSAEKADNVFFSLMIIEGLTDPESADDFFDKIPDENFQEAFPEFNPKKDDREAQLYAFLLTSLPLAIDTLQDYARIMEKNRLLEKPKKKGPIPIRSAKASPGGPCTSCGSGQKHQPCGSQGGGCSDSILTAVPPAKQPKVIKGKFPQKKKTAGSAPIFQIKVSLQGAKPPIWRRIQVPGTTTLAQLHTILQICMGWSDSHLHQFIIDGAFYAQPDPEDDWHETLDEQAFRLHDLADKLQPRFQYIYDFGDDWNHRLIVEKILQPEEGHPYAVLLTGKRACPPEDVGGIYGYASMLEISGDPEDEEFESTMEWLGDDFSSEAFGKEEIAEINATLKNLT